MKSAKRAVLVLLVCLLGLTGLELGVKSAAAQDACLLPMNVAENPLSTPPVRAADDDLMGFALAAKRYLESVSPSELAYSACVMRNEESWNSGSTYVVTMSPTGRVFFHANSGALSGRQLKPAVFQAIAAATGVAALPGTGEFGRPNGGQLPAPLGGYAVGFKRVLGRGNPLILVAGLDIREAHLAVEDVDPGDPEVRADQVVDRASLKAFVNGATQYVRGLYQTDGREAFTKAKSVLRVPDGRWRHGPIYLFIMEPSGYTIFHGAFPDKYEFRRPTDTLRDEVTNQLILPQIIEAATSNPDGGFVEYYFDNPDDDTDSATIPKVTYARQIEFTADAPDGSTFRTSLIFGAGIYGDQESDEVAVAAKSWLAHFGGAVAGQAVEIIGNRLTAPSSGESQMTLAGRTMSLDASALSQAGPALETDGPPPRTDIVSWSMADDSGMRSSQMSFGDVLLASSFNLALTDGGGDASGGRWTAWGSGGLTGFDGDAGASLGGDVTMGMVGVDYEQDALLTGVAVSFARGTGSFSVAGDRSEMEATLTTVHPHLRYTMSERLSMWGILGLGQGEMTLAEGSGESSVSTDIEMTMVALGGRGEILSSSGTDGFALAGKSDVLLTQVKSDEKDGLESIDAGTRRLRAMLEGSREIELESGGSLRPSLEAGLRHDSGDAAAGAGVEVGGRLRYMDPEWGMTMEFGGRALVAHEESGSREWGIDGSLRLAPGSLGRGLSLQLESNWGHASSGVDRMWWQRSASELVRDGEQQVASFGAEVGYGLAAPGGVLLTPYSGFTVSDRGTETYRAGGRLSLGSSISIVLEGNRREFLADDPDHGVLLSGTVRW